MKEDPSDGGVDVLDVAAGRNLPLLSCCIFLTSVANMQFLYVD
jgi:hypothetical protein